MRLTGASSFVITCFCAILFFASLTLFAAPGEEELIDKTTGIRLVLPTRLQIKDSRESKYGRNWQTPDHQLDLDTLRFTDRSLRDVYKNLKDKLGHSIKKDILTSNNFELEGIKTDGDRVFLRMETNGSEVRGISIICRARRAPEAQTIIQKAELFSAAPSPVATSTAPAHTDSQQSLTVITDDAGMVIGIPTALVQGPNRQKWGLNWTSPDRALSIDLIAYRDRSFQSWLRDAKNKRGRKIYREQINATSAKLEGFDDKTAFYIEGYADKGGIKGLSIAYSSSQKEYARLVGEIKKTFNPFGAPVIASGAHGSGRISQSGGIAQAEPMPPKKDVITDGSGGISRSEGIAQAEPMPPKKDVITDGSGRISRSGGIAQAEPISQKDIKISQSTQDSQINLDIADIKNNIAALTKTILDNNKAITDKKAIIRSVDEATNASDLDASPLPDNRLAFVLGINNYKEINKLNNAVSDARRVAQALRNRGFDVVERADLTRREFNADWLSFLKRVKPGSFVMFFFAGHGIQLDNSNYLLPSDAPGAKNAERDFLKRETINFTELMNDLRYRGEISLFVLDACRRNPYPEQSAERGFLQSGGLAVIDPAKGAFILFSAGVNEAAYDSLPDDPPGAANSVFTREFAPLIEQPGLTLQALALRVRAAVNRLIKKGYGIDQNVAYYDGLSGSACFSANCGSRTAAPLSLK